MSSNRIHAIQSELQHLTAQLGSRRAYNLPLGTVPSRLEALQEELAQLQGERHAAWLGENWAMGYQHGLLGLGSEIHKEDLPLQEGEERAGSEAYLEGFQAGSELGDTFPEARVEALEKLMREWEQESDSHPGKHIAIEEIVEVLQMETARLSSTTLAA